MSKIVKKEKEQKKVQTKEGKTKISDELKRLNERLKSLDNDFTIVATGIDAAALFEKEEKKVDWEEELRDIFSPVIVEIREIMDRPRKIEMLRSEVSYYKKRIPQIKQGVEYIEKLSRDVKDEKIRKKLDVSEKFWKQQEKEFTGKLESAQHQLFELEKGKMSVSEGLDFLLESVLRQRGRNIFLAIVSFLVTFIVCYLLRRLVMLINPFRRFPKFLFVANFIDVLLYLFTFIAATGAMILTLYITGDWLVLAIVIVILAGVGWAARNMLSQFTEQIKLLLSFGPVRQGERVVHNGIHWKVESIGIYCFLKNPLLTGGTIRLPLKDLIDMRSRPYDENEPWFPSTEGDWVLVDGKSHRQVVLQTPYTVKFSWYDMAESMPTSSFVSRRIFNLSRAQYWAGITFHIAYKHRFTDPDEIVEKLTEMIGEDMKKTPYGDQVISPWVDFLRMGNSSLEFMIRMRMKKEAGSKYNKVKRDLGSILLKAANQYGWEIIQFGHISLTHPDGESSPRLSVKDGE